MRKVEVTLDIDTRPEKIIQAFTDPKMLGEWWNVERTLIDKRVGGVYTLAWKITKGGFGFISSGTIRNYEPGRALKIDNFIYLNPEQPILGPMTLTVRAKEENGKTKFYLCQDGYQEGTDWDWYYEAVKQAWPAAASSLKKYLETKK